MTSLDDHDSTTTLLKIIIMITMFRWTIEGPAGEGGAVYISTSERLAGAVAVIIIIIVVINIIIIIILIVIIIIITVDIIIIVIITMDIMLIIRIIRIVIIKNLRLTASRGTIRSSSTTAIMDDKCRWQWHKQIPRFFDDDDDDGDDDDHPGVLEPNRGGRLHRRHWTHFLKHFGEYHHKFRRA